MSRGVDHLASFMMGVTFMALAGIVANVPEKRFLADTAYTGQIKILKNALTEPQRERWNRCEAISPCKDVTGYDSHYTCQNTHMRACMFQPLERE